MMTSHRFAGYFLDNGSQRYTDHSVAAILSSSNFDASMRADDNGCGGCGWTSSSSSQSQMICRCASSPVMGGRVVTSPVRDHVTYALNYADTALLGASSTMAQTSTILDGNSDVVDVPRAELELRELWGQLSAVGGISRSCRCASASPSTRKTSPPRGAS